MQQANQAYYAYIETQLN